MRIDSLTPGQTTMIAVVRDEWIAHGLSTAPTDWPAAEAGMILAYERAGLTPPERIVRCTSPLALAFVDAILRDPKVRDSVEASVRDSVRASVRDSVRASVRDSVRASVGASVQDSVWASVQDSVEASVQDAVWASVRDSVRASVGASVQDSVQASVGASVQDSVWASVGASVWASVQDSVNSQYESHWLAFYAFFGKCGLDIAKLDGILALNKSAGWWIARTNMALIAERPVCLRRDDRGRLHCEAGPAVAWSDGWGVYAWHGATVPAKWIEERATLDPTIALTHPNADLRSVAADIIGWNKVIDHLSPVVIDQDPDPMYGTLLEATLPGESGPRHFLRARCGTGRDIVLPVTSDTRPAPVGTGNTARGAGAWSYGLTVEQYQPERT